MLKSKKLEQVTAELRSAAVANVIHSVWQLLLT
jgi:hypothetical protein